MRDSFNISHNIPQQTQELAWNINNASFASIIFNYYEYNTTWDEQATVANHMC